MHIMAGAIRLGAALLIVSSSLGATNGVQDNVGTDSVTSEKWSFEDIWIIQRLAGKGATDEALRRCDDVLNKNPGNRFVRLEKANVHMRMGQMDAAAEDLDYLIALYPDFGQAYNSRALLFLHIGLSEDVEHPLVSWMSSDNEWKQRAAVMALGYALREFQPDIEKAKKLNAGRPHGNEMRKFLWIVPSLTGKEAEEFESALCNCDEKLKKTPDDKPARLERARLRERIGDFDAAEEDLDYLIEHHPDLDPAYDPRARLFLNVMESERYEHPLVSWIRSNNERKHNAAVRLVHKAVEKAQAQEGH